MLKVPFNGQVIITQEYRPKNSPKGYHGGTDYAIQHRTALVAPADGVVCAVEGDIAKKTPGGIKSWLANTQYDPFIKLKVGSVVKHRSLTTTDYGNYVKINHGSGISTLCSHLDEVTVQLNQVVKEGELIGYSDSTGNSTGSHLHYEIRKKDVVVDPAKFDYSFDGSVAPSDAITTAAGKVVTKEFIEKRLKEFKKGYWPCKRVVRVRSDGDFGLLYVRNKPSRNEGILAGFTRSYLKPGDIVNVIYFGIGQEVDGKGLWWMSEFGNFFWAGGTDTYPVPGETGGDNVTKSEKDELLKDLNTEKKDLEDRKVVVEGRIAEVEEVVPSPSPSEPPFPSPPDDLEEAVTPEVKETKEPENPVNEEYRKKLDEAIEIIKNLAPMFNLKVKIE